MKIVLTGASGFVGRHVLTRLQEQRHHVVAICRKDPVPPFAQKPEDLGNVSVEHVDMSPKTDWSEILKGIDAVIHTGDGLRAFEGVEQATHQQAGTQAVETTLALVKAAQQAKVRTFVYLSSIKAVSGYCADHVLDERDPPSPTRPFYGLLKADIEIFLENIGKDVSSKQEKTPMYTVSLRSPIIYGKGGVGNFRHLIALADSSYPLPLSNMTNRRSIVSVINLADGLVRAAENPKSYSGHYFIQDAAPMTMSELMTLLRKALSRKRRLFPVPKSVITLGRRLPVVKPIISRLCGDLELSSKKFETDFDWTAPVPMEKALSSMAKTYKD